MSLFVEEARDGEARVGRLRTSRGEVETPIFMPVGTQGTVKGLSPEEVASTGAGVVLANTYHLWLRPGAELVRDMGGLHRFMAWPHSVLTDSGGFQVFSLADLRKIDEDGVTFRSHIDGSKRHLTPEESMRVQSLLGSDIAMVLDVCPPGGAERSEVERAMRMTSSWTKRSLAAPKPEHQSRFGIVQGATYRDLRIAHLEEIAAMPIAGLALGGFSVGEPTDIMAELVGELAPRMPRDKPRYLMGVGKPVDLVRAVGAGIDMFDCVLPTRNARNGQALSWGGRVSLHQARHKKDASPIDANCQCFTCRNFSRSYLRHLFLAKEMLGPRLVTLHNLWFYADLMRGARKAIREGRYASWSRSVLARMEEEDEVGAPDRL